MTQDKSTPSEGSSTIESASSAEGSSPAEGSTSAEGSNYDVIIVGGGMVGLVAALALAQADLNVAVVESQLPKKRWPKGFDIRVSAITRASQNVFMALGVWDSMQKKRVQAYTDMHVWDSSGQGEIHFDSATVGERNLGHIVENRVIQRSLWAALEKRANVTLVCPDQATDLQVTANYTQLVLAGRGTLRAPVLLAADGARSWVREQCGISVDEAGYGQSAVVATVKTQHHHRLTAWQRFLPTGPLAFLPLADGYSSIVWSTSEQHAEQLLAMDESEFKLALADALANKLGAVEEISERKAFPLRHMHAQQYVKPRIALLGDAAHTIHPLAGQGVNLGIADAACLAEVLLQAHNSGQDYGSYAVLRRYERWRRGDNTLMLQSMSGFNRLFSETNSVVTGLRNLGLNISDQFEPLKRFFIRQAMGLSGELPRLAQERP